MKKKINKKSLFTKLGVVLGGIALGFGIAFGIESLVNNTKNEKDLNPPLVSVENEEGIRLRQNKVVANGATSTTITATVDSTATVKTVSWSLAWATTNSASVSDYITLTPSTDTLTCTVAVKKAFTTKIILTCKSNSNTSLTATCTIDYVGRNVATFKPTKDFSSMNFYSTTLGDIFSSAGVLNASNYTVSGGTLVGTLKNIVPQELMLAGESEYFQYILDDDWDGSTDVLIKDKINTNSKINIFVGDGLIFVYSKADLYYGTTFIKTVNIKAEISFTWNNINLVASTLNVSDTQIVF